MAARNLQVLLDAHKAMHGKEFAYDTQVAQLVAMFGWSQDAAESAVLTALRKLVPTASATDDTDYTAEFLAVAENAALLENARRAFVSLANAVNAAREANSKVQLVVNPKGATADDTVKIVHNRITRDNIKRDYKLCGGLLQELGVTALKYKVSGEEYTMNVRFVKPKTDGESGAQIFANGKWQAFESIKDATQPALDKAKADGKRETATMNRWLDVKVAAASNDDVINNSLMTIYDARIEDGKRIDTDAE